ncbi:MAG: LysR family transcriptional regulator [Burkholderiales bacterium]|nr:LysR family transcriptional regulator [Burkholderiales bacterium]
MRDNEKPAKWHNVKTNRNSKSEPDPGAAGAVDRRLRSRLRMRHFELLSALAEEGAIHRVGRRLGMTQPAASKLLREAEQAFGVTLFERTRRGVAPNACGRTVVERARLMLGVLEGTGEAVAAIAGGAVGSVSVGVYAVAAPVLLPRAVTSLRQRGSLIRVRLEEGSPEVLLSALHRGALDCVVGRVTADERSADLALEPLYDEPITVVCGPDHPLARRRRIRWSDTAEYDWILPPPRAPLRSTLERWFTERSMELPRCRVESVSILANVTMARESKTLVMLPERVAKLYAELGLVHILPLVFASTPVSVATRRGEARSAALSAFLDALREAAADVRGRDEAKSREVSVARPNRPNGDRLPSLDESSR